MKKNIVLIRENQYKKLQKHLVETHLSDKFVKMILGELVNNYEPIITPINNGNEYENEKRIKKKIDGSEISPSELSKYFNTKFSHLNSDFIKNIIKDWYNGNFDNGLVLSSNVSLV